MAVRIRRTVPRRSPSRISAGRVVLLALALVCAAAVLWGRAGAGAAAHPGCWAAGEGGAVVVVGPGDTLWTIAVRHRPEIDPRYGVYLLRLENDLDSALLAIGQELRLPPGWSPRTGR